MSGTTSITFAGIIQNSEQITNKSKSLDDLLKCSRLFEQVSDSIIPLYLGITSKKIFALEIPGGSQSSRAASCLGMARGIIGAVVSKLVNSEIKKQAVLTVTPAQVHKKATGNIKATKDEIINYVTSKYKSQIESIYVKSTRRTTYRVDCENHIIDFNKGEFEHVADAIVIAELGLENIK